MFFSARRKKKARKNRRVSRVRQPRLQTLENRRVLAGYVLQVQIVQVCDDAGTNCTALGPEGDTSIAEPNLYGYESQINEIWDQADIDIDLSYVQWNNSAALQLSTTEEDMLFDDAWTAGGAAPPAVIDGLQFFFVQDFSGTGYSESVPGSGWVANPLANPQFSARNSGVSELGIMNPVFATNGRGIMANEGFVTDSLSGTFAHEIGHGLGLRHVGDPDTTGTANDPDVPISGTTPNLMWESGAGPAFDGGLTLVQNFDLTAAQINATELNGTSTNFDPDGDGTGPLSEIPPTPITVTVTTLDDELDSSSVTATIADMGGTSDLSLREAIFLAENNFGADTIEFNLPGVAPHIIDVTSALPTITEAITIDGSTQSGFVDSPIVAINGAAAGTSVDGFKSTAANTNLYSLAIYGFSGDGIEFTGGNGQIFDNYIGLDTTGAANGNFHGIKMVSSESSIVDGNTISGNNRAGIFVNSASATGSIFTANFIGTDPTGMVARPNATDGITLQGGNNDIGGVGSGNVISGNARWGIFSGVSGRGSNQILGNLIGVNANGDAALPNVIGIYLKSETNVVGGINAGMENVISGNSAYGLAINTADANANVVLNNRIGTDAAGTADLGNGLFGVRVTSAPNNIIGGSGANEGNVISGNGGSGVLLAFAGADENELTGNKIGTNLSGLAAIPNNQDGVRIVQGAKDNYIASNQISGNSRRAISTDGALTTGNDFYFNLIGVNASETAALHNGTGGALRLLAPESEVKDNVISGPDTGIVAFRDATDLVIEDNHIGITSGGVDVGLTTGIQFTTGANDALVTGNEIANNDTGVLISAGLRNKITKNSFFDNTSIGIDLGAAGATANDTDDADAGANQLQNKPVITAAQLLGIDLMLTYSVDSSIPNSNYDLSIEFYISDGNGQGKTFLGDHDYGSGTAGASQTSFMTVHTSGIEVGDKVVAIAVDSLGNTSEFSLDFTVTG